MLLRKNKFVFILLVALTFISCDEDRVFDKYENINGSWKKTDTINFSFEQNDTINPFNLFLNVRSNNDYPYNNLYLIVSLKQPDNLVKTDTLEYLMANPDGSLMGEGFSDVKESKLWYQEGFVFKKNGKYNISISQAVRETGEVKGVENLKGIIDLGFRIEKIK
ncbi:gliding motility lipoprotein GldH [Flavobacterium sp.]|jgi:gliding motility-associated lipoprotein GldH|uniref:gliding motility lipoprotein GldH n=1 Tax=Flavobacterium sp. TaxID=239 RepID=UPI002A8121C9|nr:gliding motility lipoprotein GldH [Flavobacterium sp.]